MKFAELKKFIFGSVVISACLFGNVFGQDETKDREQLNFPHSQNPTTSKKQPKEETETPKKDKDAIDKKTVAETDEQKAESVDKKNNESPKPVKDKKSAAKDTTKKKDNETNAESGSAEEKNDEKARAKNATTQAETKRDNIVTAKVNLDTDASRKNTDAEEFDSRSLANDTLEVTKSENRKTISPTEIYKIGVGDILFVSLQNAPPNVSTYFTVLNNGAIDYPLAGGMTFVLGQTAEEIEAELRKNIKLYEDPQVSVKIREHSSHSITVLGLVEKPGIKYLQREAVPLYIIRAEAITQPRANRVAIRRAETDETEQFSLLDSENDEVLIFPGDIVEFSSVVVPVEKTSTILSFYYIGGEVKSVGQKDFYPGITLSQAILASGGLTKSKVKKVVIRRQNNEGLLVSFEFKLNDIKDGKTPDPLLEAGDTIEVES